MSKHRTSRRHNQGGTTPRTAAQPTSVVAQFSMSEVAQFSVSLDSPHVYNVFKDLIDEVFYADRLIGEAALRVVPGKTETVLALSELYERALSIEDKIPKAVYSVLEDITRADESSLLAARQRRDSLGA